MRAPREVEIERAERPRAEHDVLQHGQAFGEREVLVHHADAGIERGLRRAGRERRQRAVRPRHADRSFVGHVVAEQDVHQRGLAGAVLAEQREDFPAPQVEIDRVVGDERAEALADAGKLQDERRVRVERIKGLRTTSARRR